MIDAFDAIRGQDAAVTALRRVVAQDRIASAYLFEGPSGVGKEQAALALARSVIGEKAWPRIQSGAHPDGSATAPPHASCTQPPRPLDRLF